MEKKILVILSVILLCLTACSSKQDADISKDTSKKETKIEYVNIFFHDNAGTVVKSDKLPLGADVIQPPENILADGYVFTGWDKTLSDIQADTHFYPLYTDIRENENVIYSSAVYTTKDNPISLNIQIGGNVSFACIELQVTFDDTLLTLEQISNVDSDGVCYYDKQSKTIYCAMASGQNITAAVDLFSLQFSVKSENCNETEVVIQINDIAKFNTQNELISTSGSTIYGKIFFN